MSRERVNQKRRTRAALVAATAELMRQGQTPTVTAAADAAQVSRATAYRYFPTQQALLFEATLQPVFDPTIEQALALSRQADVPARLDTLVQALQTGTLAHEDAFRTLLRFSLEPSEGADERPAAAAARRSDEASPGHLRGGRRVRWLEEVLEPVRDQLTPQDFQRVVAALALCMGIEALVVLRDVCGLDAQAAVAVSRWAAQTLLWAVLAHEGQHA
jgi:AcrR family transcriptional regulator